MQTAPGLVYYCTGSSDGCYHKTKTCSVLKGCAGVVMPVTPTTAKGRGLSACPQCMSENSPAPQNTAPRQTTTYGPGAGAGAGIGAATGAGVAAVTVPTSKAEERAMERLERAREKARKEAEKAQKEAEKAQRKIEKAEREREAARLKQQAREMKENANRPSRRPRRQRSRPRNWRARSRRRPRHAARRRPACSAMRNCAFSRSHAIYARLQRTNVWKLRNSSARPRS